MKGSAAETTDVNLEFRERVGGFSSLCLGFDWARAVGLVHSTTRSKHLLPAQTAFGCGKAGTAFTITVTRLSRLPHGSSQARWACQRPNCEQSVCVMSGSERSHSITIGADKERRMVLEVALSGSAGHFSTA
jgi:hypothetical protein